MKINASLRKEFIIWDWNYWDGDSTPDRCNGLGKRKRITKDKIADSVLKSFLEIVDKRDNLNSFYTSDFLKRHGYDVILCSSSRSHGDAVFAGRNDITC